MTFDPFFISFYSPCMCYYKVTDLLTSSQQELKQLTFKKEKYFFCEISDQPTAKRTNFVRFVGTYIYVDKKQTLVDQ